MSLPGEKDCPVLPSSLEVTDLKHKENKHIHTDIFIGVSTKITGTL